MNNNLVIRIDLKKINVPRIAFQILFVIFWLRHTGINFLLNVYKRLPIIGLTGDYILPILVAFLIVLALPYMLKSIRWTDLLVYVACALAVVLSLLIWEENGEYIEEQLWPMLGLAFPMYLLGVCYRNKDMKRLVYVCSLICICVMFVYQLYHLYQGRELEEDNMYAAYNCLPSILCVLNNAIDRKKVTTWIAAGVGIILAFVFGTRGPILAIMLFVLIRIVQEILKKRNDFVKFVTVTFCTIIAYLLLATDIITELALMFSDWFEEIGFSTRVFDFYLEGEIADSTGRDVKAAVVMRAIAQEPFFGLGLMGDRVLLNGSYVHNIAIEIWCNFGIILGTAILLFAVHQPLAAIWHNREKDNKNFVLVLAVMSLTKLMLSSSYLVEPYLFLMLGVAVSEKRRKTGDEEVKKQ